LGGDDERSEAGHSGRAASVATEDEGLTAHHIHGAAAYEGTEDEESVQQQQQQTQEEEEQYVEVEEEQKEVRHGWALCAKKGSCCINLGFAAGLKPLVMSCTAQHSTASIA
jgi:hypothetical protein